MHSFLICSVKDSDPVALRRQRAYVHGLETRGQRVFWSHGEHETGSEDGGYSVCRQNFAALFMAREIHIIFDAAYSESLFDLGMLFSLMQLRQGKWYWRVLIPGKRLIVANPEELVVQVEKERARGIQKSFAQFLYNWGDYHRM